MATVPLQVAADLILACLYRDSVQSTLREGCWQSQLPSLVHSALPLQWALRAGHLLEGKKYIFPQRKRGGENEDRFYAITNDGILHVEAGLTDSTSTFSRVINGDTSVVDTFFSPSPKTAIPASLPQRRRRPALLSERPETVTHSASDTALSFADLQDVVLLIFYRGANEEPALPPIDLVRPGLFRVAGQKDFLVAKAIEGLTDKKLLSASRAFHACEITAKGIERVERQLSVRDSAIQRHSSWSVEISSEQIPEGERIAVGNFTTERFVVTLQGVSASDRIVTLNHNSREYEQAAVAYDEVISAARASNELGAENPAEKERILAELDAGKSILRAPQVSPSLAREVIGRTLLWLSEKFASGLIGQLAQTAWNLIKPLIGL